jgi:hypothetical protein
MDVQTFFWAWFPSEKWLLFLTQIDCFMHTMEELLQLQGKIALQNMLLLSSTLRNCLPHERAGHVLLSAGATDLPAVFPKTAIASE